MHRRAAQWTVVALLATLSGCNCVPPIARGGGGARADACTPSCDDRECGDDGCGGSCGTCPDGLQCDAALRQQRCVCPEDDAALCRRLSAACGDLHAVDLCGLERLARCGSCSEGLTCVAQACVPIESDKDLCARLHVECGALDAQDNTGVLHHVDECGPCEADEECVESACVCQGEPDDDLCRALGAECGTISAVDRCGAQRTAQCGSCGVGLDCVQGRCVEAAETDAELCAIAETQCGPLDTTDRMGRVRHVEDCGLCTPGTACDEISGRCGPCTPESDAVFCARQLRPRATRSSHGQCTRE